MKGQVAAEVAAALALARDGWRPARGELKLVVTADEETGAACGAKWLCEEHPEKVRADLVVNEGGGAAFELGGRRFYTLCVGEKGVFRFILRARGRRRPRLGPGARRQRAAEARAGCSSACASSRRLEPTPEGIAFLAALLGEDGRRRPGRARGGARAAARAVDPRSRPSSPSRCCG